MGKLPSLAPLRATSTTTSTSTLLPTRTPSACTSQVRHATFIPRARRPYTFTQLIQLSDGSTYTARTTSPQALYRATKDSRNTLTWNPSEKSLRNVELDEAGKLAAFRERFGRAFDSQAEANEGEEAEAEQKVEKQVKKEEESVDDGGYGDLISSYAVDRSSEMKDKAAAPTAAGKKKK